jgi:hypothetical protein
MAITDPLRQEAAETEALTMLAWLAGQDDLFAAFLGSTGASPADVAARATDPVFLGAVVTFVLSEDAHVLAWAEAMGKAPDLAVRIMAGLPGGAAWHWT